MRYRRAERCLLKAEAALDAGMEEDARAAIEEARTLNAEVPGFDELLAASRARKRAAQEAMTRARVKRASAGTALLALVGVAGLWSYQRFVTRPLPAEHPTSALHLASSTQAVADPAAARPVDAPAPPGARANSPAPADEPPAREAAGSRPVEPPRDRVIEKTPQVESPPPASLDVDSLPAAPPAADPPAPVPTTGDTVAAQLPARAAQVESIGTAVTAPPVRPSAPPVEATPPAAVESQEAVVRGVLARFEAAYSALSASAARQVWPSVDVRSLARAFDDLESQQVSLGACAVSIAAATARADCNGSTTWTPKVGGGSRTVPRRWQFELALASGGWHIVRAQAR